MVPHPLALSTRHFTAEHQHNTCMWLSFYAYEGQQQYVRCVWSALLDDCLAAGLWCRGLLCATINIWWEGGCEYVCGHQEQGVTQGCRCPVCLAVVAASYHSVWYMCGLRCTRSLSCPASHTALCTARGMCYISQACPCGPCGGVV